MIYWFYLIGGREMEYGTLSRYKGSEETSIYTGILTQGRSSFAHIHCTREGPDRVFSSVYGRRKYQKED